MTDKPIEVGKSLDDIKSIIFDVKYFDDSGSIKTLDDASARSELMIMLYNSKTNAERMLDNYGNKTAKGYDLLYAYTDSTSPFVIVKEVDIYDPSTDFNSIAIYNGGYDRVNKTLKGLMYAKRYNGTTIGSKNNPFEDSTTILKTNHYLTIIDGNTKKSFNPGDNVTYAFEEGSSYIIRLTVKNGDVDLVADKKIYF